MAKVHNVGQVELLLVGGNSAQDLLLYIHERIVKSPMDFAVLIAGYLLLLQRG